MVYKARWVTGLIPAPSSSLGHWVVCGSEAATLPDNNCAAWEARAASSTRRKTEWALKRLDDRPTLSYKQLCHFEQNGHHFPQLQNGEERGSLPAV